MVAGKTVTGSAGRRGRPAPTVRAGGPGSYTIGPCPICGQASVLFDKYSTAAALMAVSEINKRPGFVMINTRPHDLPKKSKVIWHIIEREVQHEN